MSFRVLKLSSFVRFRVLKFYYLVFFDKIQPCLRALKFSNKETFSALKFSNFENFRAIKFSNLAILSDSNFRVRFSSKSGEF